MSKVYRVTDLDFNAAVSNGTCVVKFWSEFCGPCKVYSEIFDEFAKKHIDIKCYSVDAIREQFLSSRFKISRVPMTIIYKNGIEMRRFNGVKSIEQLEKEIDSL